MSNFQYLTNIALEKALNEYLSILNRNGMRKETETVNITEVLGRITSEAIYAKISAPHYNACAMDGIAIEASKTYGATETTPVVLNETEYTYVDTGDPLPKEYDSVVMIENVISKGEKVLLYEAATPWQHIRQIGEDISAGDMVFPSYTKITPAGIGAMLACGISKVNVLKRTIVGIIPTGDEIVMPMENPKEGDIIEFNSSIFKGMIIEEGAVPKVYPIVPDKKEKIKEVLNKALEECDVIIVNAGSSAGRDDLACEVISEVGNVLHHGIAIKPGKPTILAYKNGKPIIGVPGYPVSGIIVLQQILKPILHKLDHNEIVQIQTKKAILSKPINSSLKYQEFVRTRLGIVNGKMIAIPLNRGAGMVSSFVRADGILNIPQNVERYEAMSEVSVQPLRSIEEIESTLVVTGSHDPLIDEINDIMHITFNGSSIASTNLGSTGAIMAIKKREAHLGGIHLLDSDTGMYNISYVKKFFPQGGVVLLECVKRIQGFMVELGNTFNITDLHDIVDKKLSYVNRQKGSGTRILFDYLLKKNNISPSEIKGYDREEFTHTNVAAAIKAKSADVGMGIYSVAKIYGLDFIPICEEEYDLLVSEEILETKNFQEFLKVLKSDEFRRRINKMGGYIIENPGRRII